jgi:hypothetical protein
VEPKLLLAWLVLAGWWLGGFPARAPAMKTFRDQRLGFSYRYPGYFEERPTAAGMEALRRQQTDEATRRRMGCMKFPLDSRHESADEHDTLSIFEFDFECMGKWVTEDSMESVVLGSMQDSLKVYGGKPSISKPQRYELNGNAAEFIEAFVEAPTVKKGMTLYSGSSCVLMRQTVVCWALMSADLKKLHELLGNPVVFDGHQGVPLVPDQLLR